MRWLKYGIAVLVSLVLFCGGGAFYWFLSHYAGKSEGMEIAQNFKASAPIEPTHFYTFLSFSASPELSVKPMLDREDRASLERIFDTISQKIKQDSLCTGGSYSIEPTFDFKDGKEVPQGQRISASIECNFPTERLQDYKNLIKSINASLEGKVLLSTPALEPTTTPERLQEVQFQLTEKILKEIDERVQAYNKQLKKKCKVEEIAFLHPSGMNELNATNIKEEANILNATALFKCY